MPKILDSVHLRGVQFRFKPWVPSRSVLILILALLPKWSWAKVNVLVLGDSLSADRGSGLACNLKLDSQAYSYKIEAYCGYSPSNFVHANGTKVSSCGQYTRGENGKVSPTKIPLASLADLMTFQEGSKKADVVVVQLGTNYLDNQNVSTIRKQPAPLLLAILKFNPLAKILWLSPPVTKDKACLKNADLMFKSLQDAAQEVNQNRGREMVTVMDSRLYTNAKDLGGDRVHYRRTQWKWVEATQQAIRKLSQSFVVSTEPEGTPDPMPMLTTVRSPLPSIDEDPTPVPSLGPTTLPSSLASPLPGASVGSSPIPSGK